MNPKFFDAHTHLNLSAFDRDREEIIRKTLDEGVWMVNVGVERETSQKAVEIASVHKEGVYAAVGVHPNENEDFDYDFYKKLAQNPKVVAIGECGLDYAFFVRKQSERLQKEIFIKQIELAAEIKKPLMIHCRNAFGDLISILKSKAGGFCGGIIHFFSGSKSDAKNLLEMGFSFSFGGVITFPPKADQPRADSRDYDEIIKLIPIDKILLETDAPYVSPEPYRGKRNEPANVKLVAQKISEIKNISFEEVAQKTTENARSVFNI